MNIIQNLADRGIGFEVLTGHDTNIDTMTLAGKLIFGIFAALLEFEREVIHEQTMGGLAQSSMIS